MATRRQTIGSAFFINPAAPATSLSVNTSLATLVGNTLFATVFIVQSIAEPSSGIQVSDASGVWTKDFELQLLTAPGGTLTRGWLIWFRKSNAAVIPAATGAISLLSSFNCDAIEIVAEEWSNLPKDVTGPDLTATVIGTPSTSAVQLQPGPTAQSPNDSSVAFALFGWWGTNTTARTVTTGGGWTLGVTNSHADATHGLDAGLTTANAIVTTAQAFTGNDTISASPSGDYCAGAVLVYRGTYVAPEQTSITPQTTVSKQAAAFRARVTDIGPSIKLGIALRAIAVSPATSVTPSTTVTARQGVARALSNNVLPDMSALSRILAAARALSSSGTPFSRVSAARSVPRARQSTVAWSVTLITVSPANIANALAARYGVGNIRFRYEQQDLDGNLLADISSAVNVDNCTLELDNDRAVARVISLSVDGRRMPAGFLALPWQQRLIAAYCEVNTGTNWSRLPLGLFYLDRPQQAFSANSLQDWTVAGSELTIRLATAKLTAPYSVTAGVNHLSAVAAIIDRLGLRRNLPVVAAVLPVAVTWPAGTTLLEVVNDLLFGVNAYPLWADAYGVLTTRPRLDPYQERPVVLYDTSQEPRMVAGDQPLTETVDTTQGPNVVTVAIDDPLRTPVAARRTNADATSIVSTVSVGQELLRAFDGSSKPSTRCVPDLATANAIASFELREAATRAFAAELHTLLDPRRTNREFLAVNIAGVEDYSRWRVASMSMALRHGGDHVFKLGKAQPVNVS